MQITVSVGTIRTALARALGVAGGKVSTMPILSSVLLEAEQTAEGGRLTVRAYDLEIGVQSVVPCEVHKPGAVAVQARLLADVVKALPESAVKLQVGANRKVEITSGSASFRLAGLDPAEFPTVPVASKTARWAPVMREALLAGLDRVGYAISSDETRYNLNGVCFDAVADHHLALVATDGHRMAVAYMPAGQTYGIVAAGVIVGRKAIDELHHLLAEETGDPGELAFADGSLLYRRPGTAFVARLIDAQFPDWTQVIPTVDSSKSMLKVSRTALRDVLRRVLLMAADQASSVLLTLKPGHLEVSARNAEGGEARDCLTVEYDGPSLEVAVNGRYLVEMASAETTEHLTAAVVSDADPLIWWPEGQPLAAAHVLMPMRR